MKIRKEDMLLYVVTDRTWLGENKLIDQVVEIVKAGATCIQLREKSMPLKDFIEEAREIKQITDAYKIPFIINDNVEVAAAVDADGVHLGQGDENIASVRKKLGKDKIIGLSVHNVEEALAAVEQGADYLGVGAVFETSTKKDAKALPLETLKAICDAVTIPVVAIGGISKQNILRLSGTGVDGAAVISAIFAQPDLTEATREMLRLANKLTNK
ncbi:MAG TPA: thiamine phosphate synthase [Mobilitalea sp.]|nr:thiamine phosphate synthase [Mobilitalea sp.]